MIEVAVYGRLGADPVERETKNGSAMATSSLAVNAARHGDDEITEWFSIVAFGTQAETLLRHGKGDLIAVMGDLHKTHFTGRDGTDRESWSLTAQHLVSARTTRPGGGRKKKNGTITAPQERPTDTAQRDFDDDIPF